MIKKILHIKAILTLVLCAGFGMAFASFSIVNVNFDKIKDKEKDKANTEKYSLKNVRRPASFFSLSSLGQASAVPMNDNTILFPNRPLLNNFPAEDNSFTGDDTYINSSIRLRAGNSIVTLPFSFKVKTEPDPFRLFKAPSAPNR